MYKLIIIGLLLGLTNSFSALAQSHDFVEFTGLSKELLVQVDAYRSESRSAKVESLVQVFKKDELVKERSYDVYTKSDNRSLVVFKSASERGQKVLMKGSDYWLFMPKSRRPIRITPMQKLLGEAALGDIATLSWSDNYNIEQVAIEQQHKIFKLVANSNKASYQNIELTVDKADLFPVKAKLYLRSGMHAKTAAFTRGKRNGLDKVIAMSLQDKLQSQNKTLVVYQDVKPIDVADRLFNPQILIRSDLSTLLAD